MRIGIRKTSLVDFPGRVAVVFFTAGCDFRCPYCHNPELVAPAARGPLSDDGLVGVDEALGFLETRRGLASGLVLSGGEPLLHPGLPELAARARALGFAVKLDTNGSLPDRIESVGADFIALDLKTAPGRYGELWPGAPSDAAARIARSVEAVRASGSAYEFRLTCAPGILAEGDAEAIAGLLRPEDEVVLQRYRPGAVLDPGWAEGVSPYEEARLERLLAIVRSAAPRARLRGL